MSDEKTARRHGMRYLPHVDGIKPFSTDAVPKDATTCGNCALFLPAGPAGFRPTLDTTAPELLKRMCRAKRCACGADERGPLTGHQRPRAETQLEAFQRFAEGVGWCMAHAPGPWELGAAGSTHVSWWCGHFAAEEK